MQAETKLRGQNIYTGEQGTLLHGRDSVELRKGKVVLRSLFQVLLKYFLKAAM